jgi:hypothetical protein
VPKGMRAQPTDRERNPRSLTASSPATAWTSCPNSQAAASISSSPIRPT